MHDKSLKCTFPFVLPFVSVNAVTPGCKSSDEILVKNAQNLLQTVLRGVHAAETACITVNRTPWGSQSCEDSWNQCTSKQAGRSYLLLQPPAGKKSLTVQMQLLFPGFEAAGAELRRGRGHGLVFSVEEESGDPSSPAELKHGHRWAGFEENVVPPGGAQPCSTRGHFVKTQVGRRLRLQTLRSDLVQCNNGQLSQAH